MMGSFGAWGWLALGLCLIAIEMLVLPGGFPLWIGISALVMAAIVALVSLSWQVELTLFAVLAVLAGIVAWKVHYRRGRVDAADGLHDRVEQLLGKEFVLDQGTEGGVGRIRVDDTVWRVAGPAMPAGTRVRIAAFDGSILKVERA